MNDFTKKHKLDDISLNQLDNNNYTPLERMFSEGLNPIETKKPKKMIDKNAPKRSMSAFLLFSKVYRPLFHKDHPDLKNTEISTMLSEKWKSMTMEEKKPYLEAELVERSKYHANMKAYNEKKAKKAQASISYSSTKDTLSTNETKINQPFELKNNSIRPFQPDYSLPEKISPLLNFTNTTSYHILQHLFEADNLHSEPVVIHRNASSSFTDSSTLSSESFNNFSWGESDNEEDETPSSYYYLNNSDTKEKDEDIMNLLNTFDDNDEDLPSITLESPNHKKHQLQ